MDHVQVIWDDDDWALTEDARERYVNGRIMELQSLSNNNEWDSFILLMREGCTKLTEAIERGDESANKFWRQVEGNPKLPGLRKNSIHEIVEALKVQVDKSDAFARKVLEETTIWVGDASAKFIVRLADQWRSKGLKPTASKSDDRKQSHFVAWVAFLMKTMPERFRQHSGSSGALSYEVSKALRQTDHIRKLIRRAEIDDLVQKNDWRRGLRVDWDDPALQQEYRELLASRRKGRR
jgi:hypothetical protein